MEYLIAALVLIIIIGALGAGFTLVCLLIG